MGEGVFVCVAEKEIDRDAVVIIKVERYPSVSYAQGMEE